MTLMDLLTILSTKKECEVITSWKEIPIRLKLPIKWVSSRERFISFDFKTCKLRHAFSDRNPIYIKLEEIFLLCKLFSNIKDELILEVETPVPAPSIILREHIRVQPTETKPVYVSFCLDGVCIMKEKVVDISESGIGVMIHEKDANKLMDMLSQIITDIQKIHSSFEIQIEFPEGTNIKTVGELRNIIKEDVYVRMGFKLELSENQRKRVRQYIMQRQREIIDQLKSL